MKDKEAGTEKELQWVLVSSMPIPSFPEVPCCVDVSEIFEKQQEGLEDTMSKYNDFIERKSTATISRRL